MFMKIVQILIKSTACK